MQVLVSALCVLLLQAVTFSRSFGLEGTDTSGRRFVIALPGGNRGQLSIENAGLALGKCNIVSSKQNITFSLTGRPRAVEIEDYVEVNCGTDAIAQLQVGVSRSLLLPVDVLGEQYVTVASHVVIVPVADDTSVTLITKDGPQSIQRPIQRHQPLVETQAYPVKITSNKPVIVLNGASSSELVNIPPVNTWGVEFVLDTPATYRLAENTNRANLECKLVVSKQVIGADQDFTLNEPDVLKCTHPVLTAVVSSDGSSVLSVIPSVTQFVNTALLNAPEPSGQPSSNTPAEFTLHLTIAEADITDGLLINSKATTSYIELSSHAVGEYVIKQYRVPKGKYMVTHTKPTSVFSAYLTGANGQILSSSRLRISNTGSYCNVTSPSADDAVDNDCDYRIDEEIANGEDDDGDGRIDEDLVTEYSTDGYKVWPVSYTAVIVALCVILCIILISLCHWQCTLFNPQITDVEHDVMLSSYDSRASATMLPPRYSLSVSRSGFTISRR